jgi:surface polysaccharide O-acyltransferase-like enzyme
MGKASERTLTKQHWYFVDYLRALSCVAVIYLHIIVSWSEKQGLMVDQYPIRLRIDTTIAEVLRVAVPIFIMISGALLLDKNKLLNWHKIKKYIVRMLLSLAIFGFSFALMEAFYTDGINPKAIITAAVNLLEERTWGHMWYIYMLIGLYILTPIIKAFTDTASKRDYSIAINLLAVPIIIIPSINWALGTNITTFWIKGASCIYYYLLGQYVMRYPLKRRHALVILIIATANLLFLGIFTNHYLTGNKYSSLPIALLATSIFAALKSASVKSNKLIALIAKHSFYIYIIHVLFIHIIEMIFHIELKNTIPFGGEILLITIITVASLLSSIFIEKILSFRRIIWQKNS